MIRGAYIACACALLVSLLALSARPQEVEAALPAAPRAALYATFHEALEARDLYGALELLPAPAPPVEGETLPLELPPTIDSSRLGCPEVLASLIRAGHGIYTPGFTTTVLHQAAAANRLYTMDAAIRAGALPNSTDNRGFLPIHNAAESNHPDAMQALLYYGIPFDASTQETRTRQPFHVALESGSYNVTRRGREMGYDMTMFQAATMGDVAALREIWATDAMALETTDGVRNTPLVASIIVGQFAVSRELLEMGAEWQTPNLDGDNAMHAAAMQGAKDLIEIMLKRGASLDTRRATHLRESLLQLIVERGTLDMLEFLIQKGAPLDHKDEEGFTPLHRAIQLRQGDKAQVLLDAGASVHTQNVAGQGLLHTAAEVRSLDMAVMAIEHGARQNIWDTQRQTPIHYAARDGAAAVYDLLSSFGALDNSRDADGRTPLMLAAANARIEMLRRLANPETLATTDNEGKTALHHAVHGGSEECLRFLLDTGANPNALDRHAAAPLYYALLETRGPLARALVEKGADVRYRMPDGRTMLFVPLHEDLPDLTPWLLDQGLSPLDRDVHGWTPLHQAAKVGSEQTMSLLLTRGGTPEVVDDNLSTPLHIASARGHILVIKALSAAGADDDPVDGEGWMPLHHAAYNGHWGPIQFFILRGAKIDTPLPDGRTPLHLAVQGGQVRTAMLLFGRDGDLLALDHQGNTPLMLIERDRIISSNDSCRTPGDSGRELVMQVTHNYMRLAYAELLAEMIEKGQHDRMTLMLEKHPSFADLILEGRTPLQRAIEAGDAEAVDLLLSAGADPAATDEQGMLRTALHWAAASGEMDLYALLEDKAPEVAVAQDVNGKTPLQLAQGATEAVNAAQNDGN